MRGCRRCVRRLTSSQSLARIRIGVVWRGFGLAKFEFGLTEFGGFGGIGAGGHRGFLEEVAPAFVMISGALRFLESLERGFSFRAAANYRDHSSGAVSSDVVQDDGVSGVGIVVCQKESVCKGINKSTLRKVYPKEKRRSPRISPLRRIRRLREPGRFRPASPWGPW